MDRSDQDQRQDETAASGGPEDAGRDEVGPQQGEAPPPEEDIARNPEDPGLDALRGG